MSDFNLKTQSPDASLDDTSLLFGADSQSAASPSVYTVGTVRNHIVGAGSVNVASDKTLTASNTLTLTGTDGSTLNVGAGGTLGSLATLTPASGVATFLGTPSSDNLRAALTDETGTGAAVFANSPTLTTPILGTPQSVTLTNATGLPLTTGVSGVLPVANGGTNSSTASGTSLDNITGFSGTGLMRRTGAGSYTFGAAVALGSEVSGTLAFGNGGTGQTSYTDGQLLIGNTATGGLSKATLTAGTNVTITNGNGTITIDAAGGGGTPGGSAGQLQYNDGSAFGGMSGTSWNDTTRSLTLTGATVTASAPVLNLSQTWNNAAVTFTGLRFSVTRTASSLLSRVIDITDGTENVFRVGSASNFQIGISEIVGNGIVRPAASNDFFLKSVYTFFGLRYQQTAVALNGGVLFGFSSGAPDVTAADTILTRRAAANLRLGAADAAAPVAQTLSVQSVVAGTTNTAGQNFTITGSQGTGSGAGGSIIFQVAPAGSSGTAQNALATALTITSAQRVQAASWIDSVNGLTVGSGAPDVVIGSAASYGVTLRSTAPLAWASADATATQDVILRRDNAANTLALRNGTNAQTFRSYFSFTDASNYTRLALKTASGIHTIETESAGTGQADIDLALTPKGTGRVRYGTHSAIGAETVTGYIEIKDAGGTVRKLAVVS